MALPSNRTGYVDTRVSIGGSYTYTLVARNANGSSSQAAVAVTIIAPPSAPSNLRVTRVAQTSVTLGWRDNQAVPPESGYEVWVSRNGTAFTHTGLSRVTTYFYRVRAFRTGTPTISSAWSNTINIRTR